MLTRALVTLALLTASAPFAAADVWKESYDVGSRPALRVHTTDGEVTIHPGPRGRIEARVDTKDYSLRRDIKVRASQTGNEVEIIVERRPMRFYFGLRRVHVDLVVPAELDLDVTTGDGAVYAEGLHGQLDMRTGDGRVEATDLAGSIEISTGDGAVIGKGLEGRVSLKTGDGPVQVAGRFQGLQVHTGDGHVLVGVEDGSKMVEGWSISTGDGPVTVRIARNLAAELYVHTGDGGIDVDANVDLAGGFRRHELRGRLNGGGPRLSIVTGDGGVRVTQPR